MANCEKLNNVVLITHFLKIHYLVYYRKLLAADHRLYYSKYVRISEFYCSTFSSTRIKCVHIAMANDDVMTWFPRREDYEVTVAVQPDETLEEKIHRLNDNIEIAQHSIKEVVDGSEVCLEHKIYRSMDMVQDIGDFTALLKECEEGDKKEGKFPDQLKKARVGVINLKAYMGQVDVEEFAAAIRNEFQFKVGCEQGFGPWLSWAERRMAAAPEKPRDFEEALKCEEKACQFLKEVVKGNKALKTVQVRGERYIFQYFFPYFIRNSGLSNIGRYEKNPHHILLDLKQGCLRRHPWQCGSPGVHGLPAGEVLRPLQEGRAAGEEHEPPAQRVEAPGGLPGPHRAQGLGRLRAQADGRLPQNLRSLLCISNLDERTTTLL